MMRTDVGKEALSMAMLGVRELCWDDRNMPLEPAMTQFSESGTFQAIAGMLAPLNTGQPGSVQQPMLAAVEAGAISKNQLGVACGFLERLSGARPGVLPATLQPLMPHIFRRVR
jgi:hypothetical protein